MLVTIKVAPFSSHKRANHSPSVSPNSNLEFSHSLPMEFGENVVVHTVSRQQKRRALKLIIFTLSSTISFTRQALFADTFQPLFATQN